jgi:hypothetical protein
MSTKGLQARACRCRLMLNCSSIVVKTQEDELFDVEGVMGLPYGSFNFYFSHVFHLQFVYVKCSFTQGTQMS